MQDGCELQDFQRHGKCSRIVHDLGCPLPSHNMLYDDKLLELR